jgi:hypothetical protein
LRNETKTLRNSAVSDDARSGLRDGTRPRWGESLPLIGGRKPNQMDSILGLVSDALLFLRVFAFAVAVPLLLRLKLSRLGALLEPRSSLLIADRDRVAKVASYLEIAIRRGSPVVRPGCLTWGVTRYYFFRRAGMDVSLCFGMSQTGETFIGHCWLEKDGQPFMEAGDPRKRFLEMHRIPAASLSTSMPPARAKI